MKRTMLCSFIVLGLSSVCFGADSRSSEEFNEPLLTAMFEPVRVEQQRWKTLAAKVDTVGNRASDAVQAVGTLEKRVLTQNTDIKNSLGLILKNVDCCRVLVTGMQTRVDAFGKSLENGKKLLSGIDARCAAMEKSIAEKTETDRAALASLEAKTEAGLRKIEKRQADRAVAHAKDSDCLRLLIGGLYLAVGVLFLTVIWMCWFVCKRLASLGKTLVSEGTEKKETPATVTRESAVVSEAKTAATEAIPVVKRRMDGEEHAVYIKLIDDLFRLHNNLEKVDDDQPGKRQALKALDRLNTTFEAHGYTYESPMGQKFNEGMAFKASFIRDERLPAGTSEITRVSAPLIKFNGVMIRCASGTVSMN